MTAGQFMHEVQFMRRQAQIIGTGVTDCRDRVVANLAGCASAVCVKAAKACKRSIAPPFPIDAVASMGNPGSRNDKLCLLFPSTIRWNVTKPVIVMKKGVCNRKKVNKNLRGVTIP